jgi:REP element-mobilizing transposase RayT
MTIRDSGGRDIAAVIDRIYCHIVWTTRRRDSLIDAGLARFLCGFLRAIASQEAARILEIGMVRTHVHLLVRIRPTTDISRLMQRLKGGSAAIAGKERRSPEGAPLRWAKGYSIHSVSLRSVADVRAYLRDQPIHHPDRVITGWEGDSPEYEGPGTDEWRSEGRRRI